MLNNKDQDYGWYLILSVVGFFSFYFAIGSYPLFDNNEGLYASIGKWMLLNKEFIIPHLNCVPYIEKPPLLYWLLSLNFSLFGFSAFAARLVTTTSALLVSVAILIFFKKLKLKEIGFVGAIIFASSIGVSIIARMVYFDMLLTFLISGALFSLFYWQEVKKTWALRVAYMFLGLAILAKGLVGAIIIGGSFVAFLVWENDYKSFRKALDPFGIVLFLAIVLPWHIAAILQHKGFFWSYIVEEHFLRFLNQREPHDYYRGPIYYYIPRMMIYLVPWSLFAPLVFWKDKKSSSLEKKLLRFGWCWLLVPLLFFSLSSAKANYYMIVGMPALSLILAIKLLRYEKSTSKAFYIYSAIILSSLIVFVPMGVAAYLEHSAFYGMFDNLWLFAGIFFLGSFLGALVIYVIRKPSVVISMIAALIVPIVITMVYLVKEMESDISSAEVGVYLDSVEKDASLYMYQDFENYSAVAFYAPRCFTMIDSKSSDLYYGAHILESKKMFLNKEEFYKENLDKPVYIVVPTKKLDQFYDVMSQGRLGLKEISRENKFDRLTVLEKQ